MNLKALYCPNCGGTVKYDIDSGKKSFFCIHCGSQILIDDDIIRTEHKEVIVDEAKIQEQLAAVEKAKIDSSNRKAALKLALIIMIITAVMALLLMLIPIIYVIVSH